MDFSAAVNHVCGLCLLQEWKLLNWVRPVFRQFQIRSKRSEHVTKRGTIMQPLVNRSWCFPTSQIGTKSSWTADYWTHERRAQPAKSSSWTKLSDLFNQSISLIRYRFTHFLCIHGVTPATGLIDSRDPFHCEKGFSDSSIQEEFFGQFRPGALVPISSWSSRSSCRPGKEESMSRHWPGGCMIESFVFRHFPTWLESEAAKAKFQSSFFVLDCLSGWIGCGMKIYGFEK